VEKTLAPQGMTAEDMARNVDSAYDEAGYVGRGLPGRILEPKTIEPDPGRERFTGYEGKGFRDIGRLAKDLGGVYGDARTAVRESVYDVAENTKDFWNSDWGDSERVRDEKSRRGLEPEPDPDVALSEEEQMWLETRKRAEDQIAYEEQIAEAQKQWGMRPGGADYYEWY